MNLYISLKWLEEHIEVVSYEGMWHTTEIDEFVSVKNIHSAPSIDIVRCKECKWYKQSEAFCENGNGLWQAGDDCFCSYGEREGE